ncbi:MAG: dipeptidase [Oscillospiraceae bacterium]|nr:dipeptidase [Oscillospiraceae bacterium]
MSFPVFDLHCDTALGLLGKELCGGIELKSNDLHIDLDRAKTLPGYAQCFACFTTPFMEQWYKKSPVEIFEREMAMILHQMEKNPKMIRQVYSAEEVQKNQEKGIMSGILTIEGPAGFGFDPALLEDLQTIGFRMTTLGWNEMNVLTGSHKTGGGLTDQGREFVKEAQRVGMMVDVSHISDEGFWDIMDITEKPIVASHSNSRAVCDNSRNLTDDMFRAICQSGGVAGFNQCAPFVGEKPDLDTVCDHILHFLELDPEGEHIALGGDLDGCDELPEGFDGVQSYPAMAAKLLERGVDDTILRKIYWENALGVMEVCCT